MKKRFSEEQIIGFLRDAEAGMPIRDLCGPPQRAGSKRRVLSDQDRQLPDWKQTKACLDVLAGLALTRELG
ncbi:hypothetical protein [Stenotrophomonas sp.]|uniref:hypothetical protein n=1 Tax=Stenotrophomonas sp. TaxID=69392 RepID=UPI0028AE305C|nr:hypothetical protein [Stenotrophomonas sp.]